MSVTRALARSLAGVWSAAAAAAVLLAALAPAEAARGRRGKSQVAAPVVAALPAAVQATPATAAIAQPLVAVVSLNAQSVAIYAGTTIVARSAISSGMSGYATPTGVFSIIQKNRYHESNIYDNAPMPFMQRLTWSGVAFHAGKLPGYPASHGCVRLPYDFAERMFGTLKMGTRVVVAPDVAVPQPVEHAALPRPVMTAVTMLATAPPVSALTMASMAAPASDATVERLLNPPQWAEHEKWRAGQALLGAQSEQRRTQDVAAGAIAAANEATEERRRVEQEIASFKNLLERARVQLARTSDDEDRTQAEASIAAFEDAIGDASAALPAFRRIERERLDESFAEVRRAREAEDSADRADVASKAAMRGSEPITIFVSRAERRVLVRQGYHTILEGDVTIRDAHQPLGTHVLTAGPIADVSVGPQWTSVSMADGAVGRLSAAAALDRIAIEPAIAAEIGRRLWTGATFLISDQPASRETGKGTDFVILTK